MENQVTPALDVQGRLQGCELTVLKLRYQLACNDPSSRPGRSNNSSWGITIDHLGTNDDGKVYLGMDPTAILIMMLGVVASPAYPLRSHDRLSARENTARTWFPLSPSTFLGLTLPRTLTREALG